MNTTKQTLEMDTNELIYTMAAIKTIGIRWKDDTNMLSSFAKLYSKFEIAMRELIETTTIQQMKEDERLK